MPTSPAPPPPTYTTLPPAARASAAMRTTCASLSTCEYAALAAPSKAANACFKPTEHASATGAAPLDGDAPASGTNATEATAAANIESSRMRVAVPPLSRVLPCTDSGPTTGVST